MTGWDALCRITELHFEVEMGEMRRLGQAEARLLAERDSLEQQVQAITLPGEVGSEMMRRAGADRAWRQWAGRRRMEIQAELARLRARKRDHAEVLARAHGRHEAAQHLQAEEAAQARALRQSRELALLLQQVVDRAGNLRD